MTLVFCNMQTIAANLLHRARFISQHQHPHKISQCEWFTLNATRIDRARATSFSLVIEKHCLN